MATTSPAHSPHWSVRLFGSLRLDAGGETVAFLGDNKDDLLLAYLAVSPQSAALRRDIVYAFWPHFHLDDALKRLSYTLWLLRRHMEAVGLRNPVLATRATLRLDPAISTDVQEFRQSILMASTTGDEAERVRLLQRAVSLYGEGLLPSYRFPWLDTERARLQAMHQEATQALSRLGALPAGRLGHVAPPPAPPPEGAPEIGSGAPARPDDAVVAAPARRLSAAKERERVAALVERGEEHLGSADRAFWLTRIDTEYPAIETALKWAIDAEARTYGLRVASTLWRYWDARFMINEGRWFLDHLLAQSGYASPQIEAKARHSAGVLALLQNNLDYAQRQFEAAQPLWQEAGDVVGEMRTLANLAAVGHSRGDYDRAYGTYLDVVRLARRHGSTSDQAMFLMNAALAALQLGNAARARELLGESLDIARRTNDDRRVATTLVHLASAALMEGDERAAESHAREALGELRVQGERRTESLALRILGRVEHDRGHYRRAISYLADSLAVAREAKALREAGESLRYLGESYCASGDTTRGIEKLRLAASLLESAGDKTGAEKARRRLAEMGGREDPLTPSPTATG